MANMAASSHAAMLTPSPRRSTLSLPNHPSPWDNGGGPRRWQAGPRSPPIRSCSPPDPAHDRARARAAVDMTGEGHRGSVPVEHAGDGRDFLGLIILRREHVEGVKHDPFA